jgi:prevent-host-death family protein
VVGIDCVGLDAAGPVLDVAGPVPLVPGPGIGGMGGVAGDPVLDLHRRRGVARMLGHGSDGPTSAEASRALDRAQGSPCGLDVDEKVAILVAMSLAEQLPLADVKNRLSEVVEQVESQHARVTITKHGRPAAVLLSADDLESLEETLALLSDPDVLARIRDARRESDEGDVDALTKEAALALARAGRDQ